jgi:hypothetical protein
VTASTTAGTSAASAVTAAGTDTTAAAAAVTDYTPASFILTTSSDTLTGSSGADTFTADNIGTDTSSTADSINGGDGIDTLNIFSDGAAASMAALTSVEILNVYDQDAALDLSATAQSSLTTVNLIRGDGGILTVGANVDTVGLTDFVVPATDTTTDDIVVNFGAARTTGTLNLSNIAGTAGDLLEDVEVNGAALTTINVNAIGTASSFDALDLAAATTINLDASVALTLTGLATTGTATLNIAGAGAVNIGTLDADINTVTSTATGALTAAIGGNVDTVFTAGSGNDVITASTTDTIAANSALAVDGGDGIDTLVLGDANDVNSAADAARYTNFETLNVVVNQNASLISGITKINVGANTSAVISSLSAAQAANIAMTASNTTSTVFTLLNATGTSDTISIDLNAGTTAALLVTEVDAIGVSVIGIETVNVAVTTGEAVATNTAGSNTAFGFLANTSDSVSAVNFTGTMDTTFNVVANTLDVVAVSIDASGMTGDGDFTLALNGGLLTGSSVKGTANNDTLAVSTTTGTSYLGMAGNDSFTAVVASLFSTGSNDNSINGGEGTDTITLGDTGAVTLTDNHFMALSNMEALVLTATGAGDVSVTTGAAFNTAFATGATITTGALANDDAFSLAAGLSSVDIDVTVSAASLLGDNADADDITVVTGSGNDTVSVVGTLFVGATDGGSISVSTGAGDDSITVTTSTLIANTNTQVVEITGGTGADTISKTSTANAAAVLSNTIFNVAEGDSLTSGRDVITGFMTSNGTYNSDQINFTGTAAIATVAGSADFGVILSHSITTGMIKFDDATNYAAELIINAGNLADVIGYLEANVTTARQTIAFAYDSTGSGTNDSTMVFNAGATSDSLVELVGVTGITDLVAAATTTANELFVL